jgi:hypothetical protein
MTREQAERAGQVRKSFFCGVLSYKNVLVGVFYMDAKTEKAFPSDIEARFEKSDSAATLASAVGEARKGIAGLGPGIRLLQSD